MCTDVDGDTFQRGKKIRLHNSMHSTTTSYMKKWGKYECILYLLLLA